MRVSWWNIGVVYRVGLGNVGDWSVDGERIKGR